MNDDGTLLTKWVNQLCPQHHVNDDMDDEQRRKAVRDLVKDWYNFWSDWDKHDPGQFFMRMLACYAVDKDYHGGKVNDCHRMWCRYMSEIATLMVDLELHKDDEVMKWFERTRVSENYAWQIVNHAIDLHARPCRDISLTNLCDADRLLDAKPAVDYGKMSEKVMLLSLLLKDASLKRYVRMEGASMDIYQPVYKNRVFMHFYERRCSVEEYISEWTHQAETTNAELYEKICKLPDEWLERKIKKRFKAARPLPLETSDRLWFAYSNGCYFTAEDRFLVVGSEAFRHMPDDLICANFFKDIEFPYKEFAAIKAKFEAEHPKSQHPLWFMAIPTPSCDEIIDFQKWDDRDVVILFWALIGRTFRNVGEQDTWQVAPLYEGKSGCGKSTIAEMIYRCYAMKDVGILSNDMQETFGLEHIYRKFIVAGLDLKATFKLPEMLANCMISGEALVVNRKHKIALDHIWNIPLLFACTEFPSWLHGMQRRLVTFPFREAVGRDKVKDELKYLMAEERAYFMKKANLAYLYWRQKVKDSGRSFASNLPKFFEKVQKVRLRRHSYAMKFFCDRKESGMLGWGEPGDEHTYVEASMLQQRFEEFVKGFNNKNSKMHFQTDLTANSYEDARSFCGIRHVENATKRQTVPPFKMVAGAWYEGVFLVANKGPPQNVPGAAPPPPAGPSPPLPLPLPLPPSAAAPQKDANPPPRPLLMRIPRPGKKNNSPPPPLPSPSPSSSVPPNKAQRELVYAQPGSLSQLSLSQPVMPPIPPTPPSSSSSSSSSTSSSSSSVWSQFDPFH